MALDLLTVLSEVGKWLWIILMVFTLSIIVHWYLAGRPNTIDGHASMLMQSQDIVRLWRMFMAYAVPVIICYTIFTL